MFCEFAICLRAINSCLIASDALKCVDLTSSTSKEFMFGDIFWSSMGESFHISHFDISLLLYSATLKLLSLFYLKEKDWRINIDIGKDISFLKRIQKRSQQFMFKGFDFKKLKVMNITVKSPDDTFKYKCPSVFVMVSGSEKFRLKMFPKLLKRWIWSLSVAILVHDQWGDVSI